MMRGDKYVTTCQHLQQLKEDSSAMNINPQSLVDITGIRIDDRLDSLERVLQYIEDIQNPYIFKVEDIVVRVNHGDEFSLVDRVCSIVANNWTAVH